MAAKSTNQNPRRSGSEKRLDHLRLSFDQLGVDAALLTHLPNVRYLCGFSGSAAALLVEEHRATLFTDSRYTLQAREECSGVRVQITKRGPLRAAGEALRARHGRLRIAYGPGGMTVAQKQAAQSAAGNHVRWVSDSGAVEKLRAVKDDGELTVMRAAAELISEVLQRVLPTIRPGVRELEVAAEIEYAIKRSGGSGTSFETIVASGLRSAWPHAHPTTKKLGKSELVVLDQGAILGGYCSDLTRTVHLGRPSRKVQGLYAAVLEAQEAGKVAVRPGVTAGEVDRAARDALRRHGLAKYFTHSTGHGLGLEIHELPRLGKGERTVLQEGMVLTVEPGVYIEGLGGIRIEDEVVVTAQGCEDLTTAPREFLQL